MEEEANSKPVLFSKDTCKVQPWEGEMAGSDARWGRTGGMVGTDWWGSSSSEEMLGM